MLINSICKRNKCKCIVFASFLNKQNILNKVSSRISAVTGYVSTYKYKLTLVLTQKLWWLLWNSAVQETSFGLHFLLFTIASVNLCINIKVYSIGTLLFSQYVLVNWFNIIKCRFDTFTVLDMPLFIRVPHCKPLHPSLQPSSQTPVKRLQDPFPLQ